jgi:hypothetical protein
MYEYVDQRLDRVLGRFGFDVLQQKRDKNPAFHCDSHGDGDVVELRVRPTLTVSMNSFSSKLNMHWYTVCNILSVYLEIFPSANAITCKSCFNALSLLALLVWNSAMSLRI